MKCNLTQVIVLGIRYLGKTNAQGHTDSWTLISMKLQLSNQQNDLWEKLQDEPIFPCLRSFLFCKALLSLAKNR